MINDPNKALFVPVHLDAVCVSEEDLPKKNPKNLSPLAPPTYNFNGLASIKTNPPTGEEAHMETPYLSDGNVSQPFGADREVRSGVHLHWQFDAAMTHGRTVYRLEADDLLRLHQQVLPPPNDDPKWRHDISESPLSSLLGKTYNNTKTFRQAVQQQLGGVPWYQYLIEQEATTIDFPALPTRWLLVRLTSTKEHHRAWLIESDYLSTDNAYDETLYYPSTCIPSPQSPADDLDNEKPFVRYLGRVRALDENWPAGVDEEQAERLSPLTAIGYGNPTFAAYARDCKNVFAFVDPAKDIKATQSLSYLLIGWYGEAKHDLLYDKVTEEIIATLKRNNWTLPGEESTWANTLKGVNASVFTGFLGGVEWNPSRRYFEKQNDQQPPQVVLANTAPEALAAYLTQEESPAKVSGLLPEEWLNALQMGFLPQLLKADEPEALYEELNHTNGFRPEKGGYLWKITVKRTEANGEPGVEELPTTAATLLSALPQKTINLLNDLNRLQREYDQRRSTLTHIRADLFAHWNWHMQLDYDSVAYNKLLDKHEESIESINKKRMTLISLSKVLFAEKSSNYWKKHENAPDRKQRGNTIIPDFERNVSYQYFKLRELLAQMTEKLRALDEELDSLPNVDSYQKQLSEAPRYWSPNDPVLLFADPNHRPTLRTKRMKDQSCRCRVAAHLGKQGKKTVDHGLLVSQPIKAMLPLFQPLLDEAVHWASLQQADWEELQKSLDTPTPASTLPDGFGLLRWGGAKGTKQNPWHPLVLHYDVEYHAVKREGDYTKNHLTNSMVLGHNHVELKYRDLEPKLTLAESTYQGTIVLNTQAEINLQQQLKRLKEFPKNDQIQQVLDAVEQFVNQQGDQLIKEFPKNDQKQQVLDAVGQFVNQQGDQLIMSQALSGFNQIILGRASGLRLPVFNPYEKEQDDVNIFARGVAEQRSFFPEGTDAFNPLRRGLLQINRIRLVDAFGQYRDYDFEAETPELTIKPSLALHPNHQTEADDGGFPPLKPNIDFVKGKPRYFALPPRLVQPTRLAFRWCSARHPGQESTTHPDTSPICGWVLTNHLSNTLMIFNAEGQHIGALSSTPGGMSTIWQPAFYPSGENAPPNLDDTHLNCQLKDFVDSWKQQSGADFTKFCDAIERVLRTIDPTHQRASDTKAVFMGRPLALVQASLKLELKGPPLTNWTAAGFTSYLENNDEENKATDQDPTYKYLSDEDVAKVEVPVRLGDLSMLADGLVGYFLEKVDGAANDGKYDICLSSYQAEDHAQPLKLSAAKEHLTRLLMLMDPRAKVHATSGLLPVKALDIPPEYYEPALQRLEFSFLSSPVLSPEGIYQLPIPAGDRDDTQWQWLDPLDSQAITPKPAVTQAQFSEAGLTLYEGWWRLRGVDEKQKD